MRTPITPVRPAGGLRLAQGKLLHKCSLNSHTYYTDIIHLLYISTPFLEMSGQ